MTECTEKGRIKIIEDRLGGGDVNFATLDLKMDRVLAQVERTNGRVTGLEKTKTVIIGILVGTALASTSGPAILRSFLAAIH
jgi:hypothetical protein